MMLSIGSIQRECQVGAGSDPREAVGQGRIARRLEKRRGAEAAFASNEEVY